MRNRRKRGEEEEKTEGGRAEGADAGTKVKKIMSRRKQRKRSRLRGRTVRT